MDRKFLYEAILGGKDELFEEIAPTYYQWLHEAQVTLHPETYLEDKDRLIDDFYRWLHQTGKQEVMARIDRRQGGADRRSEIRLDNPGRRAEDQERAGRMSKMNIVALGG